MDDHNLTPRQQALSFCAGMVVFTIIWIWRNPQLLQWSWLAYFLAVIGLTTWLGYRSAKRKTPEK